MRKKMKSWVIMAAGIIMLAGCGTRKTDGQDKNIPNVQSTKEPLQQEEKDQTSAEIPDFSSSEGTGKDQKIVFVKEYIQDAIDNANLIAGEYFFKNTDGETFFYPDEFRLHYAYSYYGKDVKQIRSSPGGDIIAVLKDGSVYNGTTLITNEYNVKDIFWDTHNKKIYAYFITEDGQVLYYNPGNFFSDDGYCRLVKGLRGIVAGCCYQSSGFLLDKNGNDDSGELLYWPGCNIDKWENVVVMSCTKNKEEGTASIAAIAADGTVYATGDYAEEILSWGELAYISMDEELIVGLKKDGTLAFAGSMADKFAEAEFSGIKAVRVSNGSFIAMTEEGFIKANIYNFGTSRNGLIFVSSSSVDSNCMMMDRSGNIYQTQHKKEQNENNEEIEKFVWNKSEYYAPALEGMADILIYISELKHDQFYWEGELRDANKLTFQLLDVNNDGQPEIIIKDDETYPHIVFGYLSKGILRLRVLSSLIDGYYPSSGVVQSSDRGEVDIVKYWLFGNGIQCFAGYYYDDYYGKKGFIMEDFEFDNIEINPDLESVGGQITLDKSDFDALCKSYIGDEQRQEIEYEDFIENTEENRNKILEKYKEIRGL